MFDDDEAGQAKREVLETLRAALVNPEDLANVPQMLQEKEAAKDAQALALQELVFMHTESVAAGLADLERSHAEVEKVKATFVAIQQLCKQSDVLSNTEHHTALHLAMAHTNIDRTLVGVEEIYRMPRKADEAVSMVAESDSDPSLLLEAFEILAVLQNTSDVAEDTIRTGRSKIKDPEQVQQHFNRVHDATDYFEQKVFSHFDAILVTARQRPRHLVTAMRIVMSQDLTLKRLGPQHDPSKSYRARAVAQIQHQIALEMKPLVQDAARLYESWWRKAQAAKQDPESATQSQRGSDAGNLPEADAQVRLGRWPAAGPNLAKLQTMVRAAMPEGPRHSRNGSLGDINIVGSAQNEARAAVTVDDEAVNEMLEILERATEVIAHLSDYYDHVVPCCPPALKVMEVIVSAVVRNLSKMIDYLGQGSDCYDTGSLLELLGWECTCKDTLVGLGLPDELTRLTHDITIQSPVGGPVEQQGLHVAHCVYVERVRDMLILAFRNLATIDLEKAPEKNGEGRLWTPGVIEMFRLLTQQVTLAASVKNEDTITGVSRVALSLMVSYQEIVRDKLEAEGGGLGFEMLIAIVNNNRLAYDQSQDLAKTIQDALVTVHDGATGMQGDYDTGLLSVLSEMSQDAERMTDHEALDRLLADVDLDAVCTGFLTVSTLAMHRAVDFMMTDSGSVSLFKQLHASPEWLSGATTATWIETVKDYLGDLKRWLDSRVFKRCVEASLKATCKVYRDTLLNQMPRGGLDDAAVERIEQDIEALTTFFSELLSSAKVEDYLEPLEHLHRLVLCESGDDFEEKYQVMLLRQGCTITPADVGRVCAKRKDISRIDAASIQRECEAIYQKWRADVRADGGEPGDSELAESEDRAADGRAQLVSKLYTPLKKILFGGGGAGDAPRSASGVSSLHSRQPSASART